MKINGLAGIVSLRPAKQAKKRPKQHIPPLFFTIHIISKIFIKTLNSRWISIKMTDITA